MNPHEQIIVTLVLGGTLRIDPDGSAWRLKTRTRAGRVRSITTPTRADFERPDGYRRIRAGYGGRDVTAAAHRIVWIIANGDIPPGREINHIDGKRGNNQLSNLELVTKSENLAHAYRALNRWRPTGERNKRGRLTAAQVAEIRRLSSEGERQVALVRRFGVSRRTIRLVVSGQTWRDEFPMAVTS